MRKAPERITASVDIEAVGKAFVKMGFVTVGTEGVPEPFEPAIYTRADTAAAQVAAAYERGVREAARHAASATGDIDLMNSILALLDNPTPDPDEQTEAQELAFRKAVSS